MAFFARKPAVIGLVFMILVGSGCPQTLPADVPSTSAKTSTGGKSLAESKVTRAEMEYLRAKAKSVVETLGEIAKDSKMPTNDEAVEAMTRLLQEMQEINQRLDQMQSQLEAVQSWIEEQSVENIPIMQNDILELKRTKPGDYLQFQWFDSQANGTNEGFALRRFRVSKTLTIDSRTSAKLAFDVSAGNQRIAAELKDAQLIYDIEPSVEKVGTQLLLGQQPLPLGFELERSSSEREFPERALYNRTMFAGERGRGVYLKHGLSNNAYVHAGVWNSLTFSDPQQTGTNTFGNLGNEVAWHAGVRYYSTNYDFGISGFFGKRPGFTFRDSQGVTQTANEADRRFIYVDAAYIGLLFPQLTLRGEMMWGKDRVPTGGTTAPKFLTSTDILGYQLQLSWQLNYRNQFHARYDVFDPNDNADNDSTRTWGFAYTYFINPNARLTAAYELIDEEGTEVKNNQTTVRLQFRY